MNFVTGTSSRRALYPLRHFTGTVSRLDTTALTRFINVRSNTGASGAAVSRRLRTIGDASLDATRWGSPSYLRYTIRSLAAVTVLTVLDDGRNM